MADMTLNIYGGNIQILPNATQAVQNFYGDEFARKVLIKTVHPVVPQEQQSDTEQEAPADVSDEDDCRLAIYISNEEALREYIKLLRSCRTARDLGEVVASMCQKESQINEELIVKKDFIDLLLPFLTKWAKGQTTDNIRMAINNAWAARKRAIRQSGL